MSFIANKVTTETEAAEFLRSQGIRPTRQRILLSRVLFQCHQHLSAAELLQRARELDGTVARGTVYNALELFVRKGLVRELNLGGRARIYDTNLAAHHHVHNIETGKIEDLELSQVQVQVPQEVLKGSRLVGLDVTLRVRG